MTDYAHASDAAALCNRASIPVAGQPLTSLRELTGRDVAGTFEQAGDPASAGSWRAVKQNLVECEFSVPAPAHRCPGGQTASQTTLRVFVVRPTGEATEITAAVNKVASLLEDPLCTD